MRRFALVFIVCAWAAVVAAETGPPPAQQPRPGPVPAQPTSKPAAPPEGYAYDAGRRRDPFVSLVGTGTEPSLSPKKGEGVASLTVSEISVRGIMESRGVFVATVRGPDTKTFLVHQGEKFADGTIKAITAQGLVVVQEVRDPLSLVKQREIRKLLRSFEAVKE